MLRSSGFLTRSGKITLISAHGLIVPEEEASMTDPFPRPALAMSVLVPAILLQLAPARAHESTRVAFLKRHNVAALARPVGAGAWTGHEVCTLKVTLTEEGSGAELPGLIRITTEGRDEALELPGLFHRGRGWHTLPPSAEIAVPRARLRIEALHGLETEMATTSLDLSGNDRAEIRLPLRRIYDPRARGLKSGNTHLHLMRITFRDAERYLREVPLGDGLDLLFVSYLRRMPDEARYTTNGFTRADLDRLSGGGIDFGWGQEHRHNFGPGEQGYGHVMLLNLLKLIRPVSIGPGIMGEGNDGRPLQTGIREARTDGGTVIWCHNALGHEDLPNWMAGLVDAQNIFDGGSRGDYSETFYRYLNLGLKVPFSTGTDWFIYDFSRVYVPLEGTGHRAGMAGRPLPRALLHHQRSVSGAGSRGPAAWRHGLRFRKRDGAGPGPGRGPPGLRGPGADRQRTGRPFRFEPPVGRPFRGRPGLPSGRFRTGMGGSAHTSQPARERAGPLPVRPHQPHPSPTGRPVHLPARGRPGGVGRDGGEHGEDSFPGVILQLPGPGNRCFASTGRASGSCSSVWRIGEAISDRRRGVILGALFRALGEIEARRLDVLVLFFEGRSVLSLVLALWGIRTNSGESRRWAARFYSNARS